MAPMLRTEKHPPEEGAVAPRIHIAARQAAALYPELGDKGVSALARLGEVSDGQSSLWVNQRQRVSLKRAMLIEINSRHRIRAEDLLSESEAFALLSIRLATPRSDKYLRDWAKLSTDSSSKKRWIGLYKSEQVMHRIPRRSAPTKRPRKIRNALLKGVLRKAAYRATRNTRNVPR